MLSQGTAKTATAAAAPASEAKAAGVALYPPSVRAQAVAFEDRDARPDYVKGSLHVKKAHDESSVEGYSLWWAARGKRLPASAAVKVVRKTGSDLRFDLPRTKVPPGAEGLMVVTGNDKGEMKTGPMALISVQDGPTLGEIF